MKNEQRIKELESNLEELSIQIKGIDLDDKDSQILKADRLRFLQDEYYETKGRLAVHGIYEGLDFAELRGFMRGLSGERCADIPNLIESFKDTLSGIYDKANRLVGDREKDDALNKEIEANIEKAREIKQQLQEAKHYVGIGVISEAAKYADARRQGAAQPQKVESLDSYSTASLVAELRFREGVKSFNVTPHQDQQFDVNGPATVLIVID